MLITSMWILKNMDKRVLCHVWQNWSYNKLNKMLIVVDLCVHHFEYRSTVWSATMCSPPVSASPDTSSSIAGSKKAANGGPSGSNQPNSTQPGASNSAQSNSKLKNKIEDLIIGSTQNVRNEITRRQNKYFSYTSLTSGGGSAGGEDEKASDLEIARQAAFKWRRDVSSRHVDVFDTNSADSMKLVLEGTTFFNIS